MDLKSIMEKQTPPMSMYRLAKVSGVSYSHIWDLVNGESEPSVLIARKLAKALGLSLTELLGDEDNGPDAA